MHLRTLNTVSDDGSLVQAVSKRVIETGTIRGIPNRMAVVHCGHFVPRNDDSSFGVLDSPASVVRSDEEHRIRRIHRRERGIVVHETRVPSIRRQLLQDAVGQPLDGAAENRVNVALA